MDKAHNISTDHQQPGDANRPADTLDRGQQPHAADDTDNMGHNNDDADTPAEDNMGANQNAEAEIDAAVDNQSSVSPEQYPEKNRVDAGR